MAAPTLVEQLEDLHEDLRLCVVSILARDHPKHLAHVAALSSAWHRLVLDYLCSLHLVPALLRVVAPGPGPTGRRRACLSALQCTRALVTVGGYNSAWNSHAWSSMADDAPGCERSAELVSVFRYRGERTCSMGALCRNAACEACWGPDDAPVWESAPWCTLPPTAVRRADLALVSGPGSTLYAVGGREGEAAHATVECLTLPRHQLFGEGWTTVAPMAEPRAAPLAAIMHTSIHSLLVAGGATSGGGASSRTVECYDMRHNAWRLLPPMHDARSYAGSAVLDGRCYPSPRP